MKIFSYQSDEEQFFDDVRTTEINGELWFVAADIARNLGYARPIEAIRKHCKEKGTLKQRIPTPSGLQPMILINESNVYRLIIKSQLPSADKFEEWLFEEVIPEIRKTGGYGVTAQVEMPNFIERYKDNIHKIPNTHFSVISEMFVRMYMALEGVGYVIPDKGSTGKQMMPDISVGRKFSDHLKTKNSVFIKTRIVYQHAFPDGRVVSAFMYPIEALPEFIRFINQVWIPKYAESYFSRADPKALDYLQKLLVAS